MPFPHPRPAALAAMLAGLAACAPVVVPLPQVGRAEGPADALPGACYARGTTPSRIETVTREVEAAPPMVAPDGTVLRPARMVTRSSTTVTPGREIGWFEIPCALREGDAAFVASVQRALAARNLYDGAVSGLYDADTRAAVLAFQTEAEIVESALLSREGAERLGLVPVPRDAL